MVKLLSHNLKRRLWIILPAGIMLACVVWMGVTVLAASGKTGTNSATTHLSMDGMVLGKGYPYRSPLKVAATGKQDVVYVANHTGKSLEMVNTRNGEVKSRIALKSPPSGLATDASRKRLYVTRGMDDGGVDVIDTVNGSIKRTIPVGHTPVSPVISNDGKTLYVCNRFDNNVSIIEIESGKEIAKVPATREPVAAVLSADGKHLFVANHLPTGAANVDRMTSVIDVISTDEKKVVKSIPLPNGAIDLRDMCLTHDGKYLLVPSIFARFLVPTTQIERGWMNTHALNLIETETLSLYKTVLLDDPNLGAANPWGVACTPDGKYICVAHSATHEVSMIDREALLQKLAETGDSQDPANDLSFLAGIRKRVSLKGTGPRGIAVADNTVYIAEYFSDSIGTVTFTDDGRFAAESVPLGRQRKPDMARLGEIYFNDASLCFQQWQSCSTCHPDGRMDAVNWDLLNDGIGNPKSTKSLLYAHYTPPAMITGVRAKAEIAVRAGIRYIQFSVPQEKKAEAIDAYLKSMRPVPSPYLVDGRLSEAATRGKKIFNQAGCAACHSGKYHTDMNKHNVGTGTGMEEGRKFDTPTLTEVWRTAPYLYDGRAATLKEIFTKFNKNDSHGRTSELSEQELNDLIEYVRSL